MKIFEFVVFNPSGKKKRGTVRAWSLSEAKRKIQLRGFYIASIKIQDSSVESGVSPTGSGSQRKGSRGASGTGIKREEPSFHSQNSFSFFEELKRFFFSKRINV